MSTSTTSSKRASGLSLGFMASIFLLIGALFMIDTELERFDIADRHQTAARLYTQGQQFMKEQRFEDAEQRFRSALALVRDNQAYRLALVQAQMSLGQLDDAESNSNELLRVDPTNGPANLTFARILVRQNRIPDAEFYYHRAIYGAWPKAEIAQRRTARLELADLLDRTGAKVELLAELLPIQSEGESDPALGRRIAQLFLDAGAPNRAAEVYQALIHRDPKDAEAHQGLGQAEYAAGDYRAAQSAFLTAYRLNPSDVKAREMMQLSSEVMALDPMLRRLSPAERLERSRRILQLTLARVDACIARAPGSAAQLQLSADAARNAIAQESKKNSAADPVEVNLTYAEQLWDALIQACGPAPPNDSLAAVIDKLRKQ